jgi:hypothetical protein
MIEKGEAGGKDLDLHQKRVRHAVQSELINAVIAQRHGISVGEVRKLPRVCWRWECDMLL